MAWNSDPRFDLHLDFVSGYLLSHIKVEFRGAVQANLANRLDR